MADSTLTTVVVTNHNYGRFLRDAVMSVLSQRRRPAMLIVDDASQDESRAVIADLARNAGGFEHVFLDQNVGLSRARNLAAARAHTEWLVFLDADDWLHADYVANAERQLREDPAVDVLTTDMCLVGRGRERVVRAVVPDYWDDLLHRNTIVQTSFVRRTLVRQLGGYDPTLDFEDWDFWIRARKAGARFARLPGVHVYHREHGANKSKTCDEQAAVAAIRGRHALR